LETPLAGAERDPQAREVGLEDPQHGQEHAQEGLATTQPSLHAGKL
jgi:hypothetical protein